MARRTIGELEDELKRRDERIAELRDEIDEQRDLIRRMQENIEDASNTIERWKETFEMTTADGGGWTWGPFWDEHNKMIDAYSRLVRKWNAAVPRLNAGLLNVGRPLAASEAQCATVRKLHKSGRSLREIAEDTSLGLRTVRTIVDQRKGMDRTTKKHRDRLDRERVDPSRYTTPWKRQKRTGAHLPQQAQRVHEDAQELIKEAKGLGRVRAGN